MIRRLTWLTLVAWALSGLVAGSALAEVPTGPRLSFMRSGGSGTQLITSNPEGGDQQVVADSRSARPIPYGPLAWSADGASLVFPGVSRRFGGIYIAHADGSHAAPVGDAENGFEPILSPDGQVLAFARERERSRRVRGTNETVYDSVSIWLVNLGGGSARRITPWRNGLFETPSSFSPDGSILAVTRSREQRSGLFQDDAVALRLDGSMAGVLAKHAREPVYSPDGMRLAMTIVGKPRRVKPGLPLLFSPTDLALANADGSGMTKLTHTPRVVEQEPSWDPSGERLAFTQHGLGTLGYGEIGGSIMEINADGTCRTKVLSYPKAILRGVSWQPGRGREAGPIAC